MRFILIAIILSFSNSANTLDFNFIEDTTTSVALIELKNDGSLRSRYIENKLSKIHYLNLGIVNRTLFKLKYEKLSESKKKIYFNTLKSLKTKMEKTAKYYQKVIKTELSAKEANIYLASLSDLLLSKLELGLLYGKKISETNQSYPDHSHSPGSINHGNCHDIGSAYFDDCNCVTDVNAKCSNYELLDMSVDEYEFIRGILCMNEALAHEQECILHTNPNWYQFASSSDFIPPPTDRCETAHEYCNKAEFPDNPPPEVPQGPFPEDNILDNW